MNPLPSIPEPQPPMGIARALVGGGCAVATQHGGRTPARQAHQVALSPTRAHPFVRERVPQLVRVQALDAGLSATALQHLHDAVAR